MKTMQGAFASACAEQIADARGADADEHLHELRAAQAEERHLGLAGHGFGEQRLARTGRSDEQHSLRNSAPDVRVFLRMLQKLDDLHQLFFGLVDASYISEAHLHVVFGIDLRAAPRERHHAPLGAPHLPEEEAPEPDQEQQRNNPAQQLGQPSIHQLAAVLDAGLLELGHERGVLDPGRHERIGFRVRVGGLQRAANNLLADSRVRDLALCDE